MYSNMYSLLILTAFSCLILWGCKKQSPGTLSRKSCLQNFNNLRGLFALEIVLGHIVRYENTILFPLGKFMICSVAFFYFVSAFGMAISFEEKENYLSWRFLLSKPVYIFVLSVSFFIAGVIVDAACPTDLSYITPGISWAFMITTNWYIWELIGFYLIFFFVYKYIPRFRVTFICIITLILSIVMYQNGFWEAYVASTLAFPAGLLCGEYFPKVKSFLYSWKGVVITIILGTFGLSCLSVKSENLMSIVFMRNSLCLAAIIIIFYTCNCLILGNNPVSCFLCRYSTEIYLSQFIFIRLAESYQWNYMIRMPFVLITTVLLSVIIHPAIILVHKILSLQFKDT